MKVLAWYSFIFYGIIIIMALFYEGIKMPAEKKFFLLEIAINIPFFSRCMLFCLVFGLFFFFFIFFLSCPGSTIFVFFSTAENQCRKNNSWCDFDWGCAEVLLFTEYSETHEAWQSTHVTLPPIFEKLPEKSDWNWPVVFILLFPRDRFAGLEHFNILFRFLLEYDVLLTDFKRKGGPERSQESFLCPTKLCKILLTAHLIVLPRRLICFVTRNIRS